MKQEIEQGIQKFVEGANALISNHYQTNYPSLQAKKLGVTFGKKYAKVVVLNNEGKPSSVYAFVDLGNGNVLKAASWNTPAKHARGNVLDEDNGLKAATPYGIVYLR